MADMLKPKHAGGRPLKFSDPIALSDKIDGYFAHCASSDDVPTVSGLAVYLGCDRDTLLNYQDKAEFVGTIKGAKDKIAALQESLALRGKINTVAWIFSAKNNLGWRDKVDHEITGTNGGPLQVAAVDLTALSQDELYKMRELLAKAQQPALIE